MPGWQDAPVAGKTPTQAHDNPDGSITATQPGAPAWAAAPPVNLSPTAVDRPEAVDRFVSNFASAINPIPGIKAIATDPQGLRHGIESNIFDPQRQQFIKAGEAAQGKGEFKGMTPMERASEAFGHGAAGALPLAGPAAANAGDQIGEGDIAGGLGSGAGLLSTMAVPDLMSAAGRGISRTAEPVTENALGIRNVDRKFGRNPGRAALDETSGVRPETVSSQAGQGIADLTAQRDTALKASPNKVSLKPARDVVDNAITRAAAGNSDTGSLSPIREQLTDPRQGFGGDTSPINTPPPGTIGPSGPLKISELQDPMNALAIRQRLGSDFTKFDMARPVSREAQSVGNKAYGALTNEIHNAVPESGPLDTRISNLIPVRESADVRALAPDTSGRILHRFIPHTGALIGAAEGFRAGGIPGAVAGLTIPELMADPTAQMIAARGLDTAGKVTRHPITGQVIRGAQNIRNQQPQ
jgi:hypothetical protein